jgi:hypothetical protein
MLTAASRSDLAVSLAMLAVAELPTALFLLLVAHKARQFEASERVTAQDERRADQEAAGHRALLSSRNGRQEDKADQPR